jgi:hypothetical protein
MFHFWTSNLHYLGIRWTAQLEGKQGLSSVLNWLFKVFKTSVRFKPKVSRQEQYDSCSLLLVSGWYCSLQRSLLWSSTPDPSPLPLLKAFLELLFCDAVHHHLGFSLNLDSTLKSLSLYLDFHLWKQENIRRKFLSFVHNLAHKKLILLLVTIQQMGHKFCSSLCCV